MTSPRQNGCWAYPPRPRQRKSWIPVLIASLIFGAALGLITTKALASLAFYRVNAANICGMY